MPDFNDRHPELGEGEVFKRNVSSDKELREVQYTTKRVGKVAYDGYGNVMPGARPVFVTQEEERERGRLKVKSLIMYKK